MKGKISIRYGNPNRRIMIVKHFIVSQDVFICFTKEWISEKTSVLYLPKTPGNYIAQFLDSYDVNGLITGADYLEGKKLVILSGYTFSFQPFLMLLYDFMIIGFSVATNGRSHLTSRFTRWKGLQLPMVLMFIFRMNGLCNRFLPSSKKSII